LVLKPLYGWKLIVNAVAREGEAIGFDLMTYKYFNVNEKQSQVLKQWIVLNDKVKFNANYTFTELERQSRIWIQNTKSMLP
jgi:vitamin B12 transporter